MAKDSAIAASSNITFIALTATPKAKTLRLFGTERDGRWEAFDTYTMAQAIEEGFILDVLANYSTYDMFLRVKNTLEGRGARPRSRSTPARRSPASSATRGSTRPRSRRRSGSSSSTSGGT